MSVDRIEQELHATVRRFYSVRSALLWYVEQRGRRTGRALSLDAGGCSSQEHIDRVNATFARVAICLVGWDREHDREPFPLGPDERALRRFDELAQWMRSSAERGQQHMADRLELTMQGASRYFGHVEGVLRRRMHGHVLLVERGER